MKERIVYFVQAGDFIKIGLSSISNFGNRLKCLRDGTPFKIVVLGTMDGDRQKEQELHSRFDFCHFRNEWFRVCPELLAYIEEAGKAHEDRSIAAFNRCFEPPTVSPMYAITESFSQRGDDL